MQHSYQRDVELIFSRLVMSDKETLMMIGLYMVCNGPLDSANQDSRYSAKIVERRIVPETKRLFLGMMSIELLLSSKCISYIARIPIVFEINTLLMYLLFALLKSSALTSS